MAHIKVILKEPIRTKVVKLLTALNTSHRITAVAPSSFVLNGSPDVDALLYNPHEPLNDTGRRMYGHEIIYNLGEVSRSNTVFIRIIPDLLEAMLTPASSRGPISPNDPKRQTYCFQEADVANFLLAKIEQALAKQSELAKVLADA